ncbi:MAG: tripartite tricarboxylate transporter permease [Candidatus Thermoplasmatota archaeon]|nr:tripartite tricarboxylate transporter permease [Candidatus Thermoplasmatota archaeon]
MSGEVALRPMPELGLLLAVAGSSVLGSCLGFCAGLVPGFHMNNIAAATAANAIVAASVFGPLSALTNESSPSVLLCCFLSACMVAHMFSEAVPSTYVGIPSEDVVSVLPAHRLAKAGMGNLAVLASAIGSLEGLLAALLVLCPVCFLMSPPIGLYGSIRSVMFLVIAAFCSVLLLSEGFPSLDLRKKVKNAWTRVLSGAAVFVTAGLVGTTVLTTNYFACGIPDFPWMEAPFVPRSSLLLPMFAGLFGVPGLLLSLRSRTVAPSFQPSEGTPAFVPKLRDITTGMVGGLIVGWMPGMTSGSAATLCSPSTSEHSSVNEVRSSLRFIWLYSVVSSSGAVFALGALFVISRARSGTMEAVKDLLGPRVLDGPWTSEPLSMASILIAMLLAGLFSFAVLTRCDGWLIRFKELLCSRRLAIASLVFVVCLSVWLTGSRGALLMATCASLGLIPPLVGVRRIQLMGCLLVPVGMTFFGMMF